MVPQTLQDPWMYVAITQFTILGGVIRLILAGQLAPKRVIDEKNKELDSLKEVNKEDREQLTLLLTTTVPTMNALLVALKESVGHKPGGAL